MSEEKARTETSGDGSAMESLPRGPHGLPRETVEASQRRRILLGMTEAVAELGYAKASVAEVIRRAGVSRSTFYALFADRESCFIAAFEVASSTIAEAMWRRLLNTTIDAGGVERADALLVAYLETLTEHPQMARTFLVEVFAAGPRAVAYRRSSMQRFVTLIGASVFGDGALPPAAMRAIEGLVHAVSSMVTLELGAKRGTSLMTLREPVLEMAHALLASPAFEQLSSSAR